MKYKVIGWTYYDDTTYPDCDNTWAITNAVMDDIKAHGYCFTGEHHQEDANCTPILNNGKMVTFSRRGFGGIMAEAHGELGPYAYALFTDKYGVKESALVFPDGTVHQEQIVAQEQLMEEYTIQVDKQVFDSITTDGLYKTIDKQDYRYMEIGEKVHFVCEGQTACFNIVDIERKLNLTEEDYVAIQCSYKLSEEDRRALDERVANADTLLTLVFRKPTMEDSPWSKYFGKTK